MVTESAFGLGHARGLAAVLYVQQPEVAVKVRAASGDTLFDAAWTLPGAVEV